MFRNYKEDDEGIEFINILGEVIDGNNPFMSIFNVRCLSLIL